MADSDCDCGRGSGRQLLGSIHLTLHPRNLLNPHFPHLHLRDLCQTHEGFHSSFLHSSHVNNHFAVLSCTLIHFRAQIFKTHPLILNYEHLNDTLDNPFHPVVKEHIEVHLDGNVTVKELEVERAYPNTALLSMCLMFGCFFIAYFLRQFKTGTFFPGPVRTKVLKS